MAKPRLDRIRTYSRQYDEIVADIRESLPVLAPSWTAHGLDEPGMAILDIQAGISDGLHYNIDRQAREMFLPTAVLPESIERLAGFLNYRPKRWLAAQGEVAVNAQAPLPRAVSLPVYTRLNLIGRVLTLTEQLNLPQGFSGQQTVPAVEGDFKVRYGQLTGDPEPFLTLPFENVAEQLFELVIGGEVWYDATNHPLDASINRFYYSRRTAEGRFELRFRPTRGPVPRLGDDFELRYLVTTAADVPAASFPAPGDIDGASLLAWAHTDLTNSAPPETPEQVRDRAPASNSTRDRAVTGPDYLDLAQQIPGVKSIYARRNPLGWNTVEIGVATLSGDAPSATLLEAVKQYYEVRNTLVTTVRTSPANYRRFTLGISVHPNVGFSGVRCINDVDAAVRDLLSYDELDFGFAIRLSNIIGNLEQLDAVDYLNITALHWQDSFKDAKNLVPAESEYPVLGELSVSLE